VGALLEEQQRLPDPLPGTVDLLHGDDHAAVRAPAAQCAIECAGSNRHGVGIPVGAVVEINQQLVLIRSVGLGRELKQIAGINVEVARERAVEQAIRPRSHVRDAVRRTGNNSAGPFTASGGGWREFENLLSTVDLEGEAEQSSFRILGTKLPRAENRNERVR
jgi:hypothetical protein